MIGGSRRTCRREYGRGLENLDAGESAIARIDGRGGRLWYRGYAIEELAERATFEETAYLVLHGELPDRDALGRWRGELIRWRRPPVEALDAVSRLPGDCAPFGVFRTAFAVAACRMPEQADLSTPAQWRRAPRILSWSASLAAAAVRRFLGRPIVPPRDDLGHASHFLWLAGGREPDPDEARAFEVSLIVQAEHGLHAAALAALTVASTGSDLDGAVLAGMGAIAGELHGGANRSAFEMIHAQRNAGAAREWARERIREKRHLPGFGHRIYKTRDPRERILEPHAERLLLRSGRQDVWERFIGIRDEIEGTLGSKGVHANVDAVTGLIYDAIGLPPETFAIPFCLAIQTGWMSHCLEYLPDGRVIEPGAIYVGPGRMQGAT
jgi:citrate synthase